ncbi:MAG: TonB-dependent receptor [Saprospiraceae bacterium]|nr:TonB-dependent receptor [Saprospiraceae bacterium]
MIVLAIAMMFQMSFTSQALASNTPHFEDSQNIVKPITGTVSDENGEPLIGVNVLIQGSSTGTITDIDGNFSIEANVGDILVISYIGYEDQLVTVGESSNLNISLSPDGKILDEIVVIGYGTQKKSHLTGSISRVGAEDIEQLPVARVDDALVGRVSGVNIASTEGEAGSAPTIRIRGTGSMVASSDPLIVVDGLIVDNDFLGSLDMNDIASFEVLKDAASSAIYGSRGGNGVILVTTKDGRSGDTKFSYNGYYGVKEAFQSDDYYFSIAETAAAEMAANGELSDRTKYKQLIGIDRDWQDVIFDGGSITGHSFSARGGNKKSNFSATFGYLHDEGVLLTDDFKKYNFNLKVRTKVNDRLSFGASLAPSYTDRRRFDGSTHDILRQTPWLPLYHDENTIQFVDRNTYPDVQVGDYANQRHFDNYDLNGDGGEVDISNTSNVNPAAKVIERDRNDYKFKMFASTFLQYKIADGLNFKTVLSGDYQDTKQDRWQGLLAHRNGASNIQLDLSTLKRIHLVNENYFTYDKEFGKHELNSVLGFSAEKYDTEVSSVTGTGYDSDLIQTISAATTIAGASSAEYQSRFLSVFGRMNYAYDYKYLASVSFRRDGSSVFGPDSKYGVFPAVSLGWVASEESFLKESSIFDYLKFRMSYGFTGNNRLDTGDDLIDNYPYIALLNASTAVVDGSVASGFNALNISNPDLKWERSREINPGVDFALFDNFLSGSLDYYKRTSDQLLLYNPISSTTGFTQALINLGEVENSGIELELRTSNIRNEDFSWSTTFIASKNENNLVDFADSDGQIQNVDSKRAAEWINATGNPISSFYGWVVDRDIPLEYLKNAYHPVGGEAQDVYVKDLNGDGIIDDDDKTIIGNPYPELVWSLSNDFSFKGFDLGIMFQGSHGAEIRNMGDQYLFNHFNSAQDFDPETTPDQGFIKQKIFTDDIIQDASYISLRNVTLGYNFDKGVFANTFSRARVYVAGQNLIYKTAEGYTGFNPESINTTSPTTYGYQRAGSPIQRTISVGVNLEF